MDAKQILEMITANRKYIRLKSNIALQNLAMLHKSFDGVDDEECHLALSLNDGFAEVIFNADYTTAINILSDTLKIYPDSKYILLTAEYEAVLGRCYTYLTQYSTGRKHLLRAESMAYGQLPDTDEAKGLRADVLHNLAMNNHHGNKGHDKTVAYLHKALQELEGTNFVNRKGVCLMGIGNVRLEQQKMEEALSYYMKAKEFFEEAENYSNLSTVYSNIGICYTDLGQFDAAELYIMRGLDMRTRLGSYWEIANSYYTLAKLYIKKGDNDRAYDHLIISRDYAMVSQAVGVQRMILKELAALSKVMGDTAAEKEHRSRLMQIESVAA